MTSAPSCCGPPLGSLEKSGAISARGDAGRHGAAAARSVPRELSFTTGRPGSAESRSPEIITHQASRIRPNRAREQRVETNLPTYRMANSSWQIEQGLRNSENELKRER